MTVFDPADRWRTPDSVSPPPDIDPWKTVAAKGVGLTKAEIEWIEDYFNKRTPPTAPHDLGAGDLVLVEWDDATQPSHGWVAPGDIDPAPAICQSVGWIVHRDERAITLASTKCDGGEVMGAMRIPVGTVKKITHLSA